MCLHDQINQAEPQNSFIQGDPNVFLDYLVPLGFAYKLVVRGEKLMFK